MKPIKQQLEPVRKPLSVKIVQFQPVVIPTPVGTISTSLFGLGDDDKIYSWESKLHEWILT